MRSNVAIRPLPFGTKIKQSKKDNYLSLLEGNNNSEIEAKFWSNELGELEEKYKLLYKPGKELFQIYYHAGKNDSANKMILNEISQKVKETNDKWELVGKTFSSFVVFKYSFLEEEYKNANKKLVELEEDKNKFLLQLKQPINPEDETVINYLKDYTQKRNNIQEEFSNLEKVKEISKLNAEYNNSREKTLREFVENNNNDFDTLLKDLEFKK